jgi:tetratricopeptide (TPR) repeat protein
MHQRGRLQAVARRPNVSVAVPLPKQRQRVCSVWPSESRRGHAGQIPASCTSSRAYRADVLKALGRLDEALAAYDATIERFPDEWFRYHGLGVIALRRGALDRAHSIFHHGAQSCPFPEQRARFEGGVALERLRRGKSQLAANDLSACPNPSDALGQVIRNLILAHAFAAGRNLAKAKEYLVVPTTIRLPEVVNLRDGLALRYGLDGKPANDNKELDQRIFEAEIELLAA